MKFYGVFIYEAEQCKAISKSTGKRCLRSAMKGDDYCCDRHIPKDIIEERYLNRLKANCA